MMTIGNVAPQETPKKVHCVEHEWHAVDSAIVEEEELPDGDEGDTISWTVFQNTYRCIVCGKLDIELSSIPA